jgi:MFS family permease
MPALFAKLLIPDILFTTGEGAVVGLLSVFFSLRFRLSPGPLGLFFTLAGLVGGATSLTAPRVVRRFGQLRMATLMQFLTVPVMLVMGFSPLLLLAVLAELTRQILRGLFEPVYAAFAMGRVTERHRGTLSGFYSVTWSVGFSLGPITAGWLYQQVGLSSSFVIAALCVGLSGTLLRIFFAGAQPMLRKEQPDS